MSDYFDRLERQLVRATETRPQTTRPRPRAVLGPLAALVAVIVVVVIAATVGQPSGRSAPATGSALTGIMLTPPVGYGHGLKSTLDADVVTLRHRLGASFSNVNVTRVGQTVVLSSVPARQRTAVLRLTVPGRLRFLDWEANVLLPGSRTVASGLGRQDPKALAISQGVGGASPGTTGTGGASLLQAVKLAAQQPPFISGAPEHRTGAQYFLFRRRCHPDQQRSCLLAGPAPNRATLLSNVPPGTRASGSRQYIVPSGILILRAATPTASGPVNFADPTAQYFVARDDPALTGAALTSPQTSTDMAGHPDVTFGFSDAGTSAFQRATAAIAHRGDVVSSFGQTVNQHFAVTLDDRILMVASIDFKTYPDGITGGGGADITGAFTRQSAQELATLLQSAPLAVPLTPR
jgi:SecD/SecF fusion protein